MTQLHIFTYQRNWSNASLFRNMFPLLRYIFDFKLISYAVSHVCNSVVHYMTYFITSYKLQLRANSEPLPQTCTPWLNFKPSTHKQRNRALTTRYWFCRSLTESCVLGWQLSSFGWRTFLPVMISMYLVYFNQLYITVIQNLFPYFHQLHKAGFIEHRAS